MRSAIRKMGNSSGVILPKAVLAELKMSVGDSVDMTVLDGKLTIQGIRRHPREGWAEEARLIAAEEQVDSEWLDFPNDRDDTLTW